MICRRCKIEIPDGSKFCFDCGAKQEAKKRKAHKRASGTGSITKLKGNRKEPYLARKAAIVSDDGEVERPLIGAFATYAEAEMALYQNRIESELPKESDPVSEYAEYTLLQLYEEWQKTRDYKDISKQTQANYKAAIKYFKPHHNTLFRNLRKPQFQQAVDLAESQGKSRSTMEKVKALSTLLSDFACENDVVTKSYAKKVRLPPEGKKKAPEYFSDIEVAKLEKNIVIPMIDMAIVLVYTGMRITEMLTLTRFDVDIKEMLITGGVKTDAGKDRIIPIHPSIQHIFRERYASCEKYIFEEECGVGNKKKGTFRIVKKKYRYEHFCDLYYAALESVGVRRLTPHKARHTFFTRFDARCSDDLAIALIGGHSDPDFTKRTYVHPDIERLRKAIACL